MTKNPGPDPGKGKRLLEFLKRTPERYAIYQPYTIRILLEQGKENNFSMEESKIISKIKSLTLHRQTNRRELRDNLESLTSVKDYTWHSDLVIFDDEHDPPIWKLNPDEFDEFQTEEILKESNKEIGKFHVHALVKTKSKPEVYFVFAGDRSGGMWYDEFVKNIQDPTSSLDWETAGIDYREHANFDLTTKSDDEIRELPKGMELTTIKNIKKGSIVVINKNNSDGIVNTGIVTKEYYFEKDATSYIHRIGVKYLNIPIPQINYEYIQGIYHSPTYQNEILKHLLGDKKDLIDDEQQSDALNLDNYLNILDWKPNLILYGPPGTGKTFIARELAKKLQKKNKLPDIFMLKGPWSNWEFNISRNNPSWATTDVKQNLDQYNLMKIGDYVILQNYAADPGPYNDVGYFGIGKITKLFDSSEPFFPDEIEAGKILWQKRLEFEIIKKVDADQMIRHIDGLPKTKGLSRIANEDNIRKLLEEIESKWGTIIRTKLITFHPSYSYEDFMEGIRPKTIGDQVTYDLEDGIFKKICGEARKDNQNPKNKYVLIIDEVNRGNIPKIFGELITLVEKDKRNNLSIDLAYSKKEFSIPDNLYIICTMNTADKSLIQMDTALRRRFVFMEIMPEYELPQIDRKIGKINLGKLLGELNTKIRKQNLRDKQIGHSYFMSITNISELQRVFKYEIIPLLQDYFYDDYALLEKILGKKIISIKNMSINYKFIDSIKFEDELDKISRNKLDDENINSDEEPVKNDNN